MQIEYAFFALLAALLIGGGLLWSRVRDASKNPSRPPTASRKADRRKHDLEAPSSLHDPNSVSELPSLLVGTGDPMADAALNLKYGRNAQAIYILKEAFIATPPMLDAGMKLAEILLSTNDIKSYNKVEARFKMLTNEEGPLWEALKIMKADFLGSSEEHNSSNYMDFNATDISNNTGPVQHSNHRPIGAPSQRT
jgi:hypothetical protein